MSMGGHDTVNFYLVAYGTILTVTFISDRLRDNAAQ